jgi:Flp pilus assembly secretin CpaC
MRRIALAVLAASLFAAPALAQSLTVRTDQAVRIALASPAKDVAVGNPAIADVTVMDERNILVLGKSFGTTNVVVLDRAGRMILDRTIIVTSADSGQVTLYRGGKSSGFACSPRCEATDSGADASKSPNP